MKEELDQALAQITELQKQNDFKSTIIREQEVALERTRSLEQRCSSLDKTVADQQVLIKVLEEKNQEINKQLLMKGDKLNGTPDFPNNSKPKVKKQKENRRM